jgi:hypothetical protein
MLKDYYYYQMASASLLKLLTTGLQDERLLPKGQVKPFQKAFVKAGRFTTETYRVDFDNQPAFGTTARVTLPRRGQLIRRVFLVTVMPDISATQAKARAYAEARGLPFAGPTFGWTNSVGHALLTNATLTIGGAPIDSLNGPLLEVLDEFTTPLEKTTTVNRMIGRYDNGFTPKSNGFTAQQTLITPLPFWFSREPSSALPIDAIGTDLVQLNIGFNSVNNLYTTTSRWKMPNAYNTKVNSFTQDTIELVPTSGTQVSNKCLVEFISNDVRITSPPSNPTAPLTLPPMASSPFYVLDPSGQDVYGLNGNPEKSVKVTQIPGIKMADSFQIQSSYLLVEYVYIDRPEANRFRLSDLTYPVLQHYTITQDTKGAASTRINMRIPNICRQIFFTCHRNDADLLNAPFLATRDLSGVAVTDPSGIGLVAPWWPDAQGLSLTNFGPLIPAYSEVESEPIESLSLNYDGRLVRYASSSPGFFRSILPSLEQRKSPWHNKYIYNLPFGTNLEDYGIPTGHANLDKIQKVELALNFKPERGSVTPANIQYTVSVYAETYNLLKVYGGRAGLLFNY